MSEKLIRKVAKAIDAVQLFSRMNDLKSPPRIEICRYGQEGEPEIVVVKTLEASEDERTALNRAVSIQRAKAAIEAMKG